MSSSVFSPFNVKSALNSESQNTYLHIIYIMKILINEQRVKKGVSLRELSAMTGISKSALNAHENGDPSPTLLQLEQIAKALNIRITDLFESDFK